MKITFIPHGYHPKPVGGLMVVYEYANQLAARGHDVTVVHPDQLPNLISGPRARLKLWMGGRKKQPRYSTMIPQVDWHQIDSRVKMLRVSEPKPSYIPDGDAVVATFWATAEYAIGFPQEKGEKFYLVQDYGLWAGPKARVDATWRSSLRKIVISRWLYETGIKMGVPANKMIYIPNAIDHRTFRLMHPVTDRPQRIAMVFHTVPWKGAEDGIRALELVRKQFPKLQAVLFGIFPRPTSLPDWIEYSYDPSQEELVGSIYNGSSIYVCPSWLEGFGLPPAEAMACGCAVISTDNGGVRDFAENEVTALLSPPKNPTALAVNIVRLLNDDNTRIKLAKAGHERIQGFSWEQSTNLLEQVLMERMRQPNSYEKRD